MSGGAHHGTGKKAHEGPHRLHQKVVHKLRTRRIRWKGDLLPVAVLFLKQPPAAEALQSGRAPLRPPAPDPTSEATPSSNMAPHMQGRQAKVQEGPSGGALPPLPPLKKKGPCPPVRNPP